MKKLISVFALTFAAVLGCLPYSYAQQAGKVYRVGGLGNSRRFNQNGAFVQRLRELGYVDGKNIAFEVRDPGRSTRRLSEFAAELVTLRVDVLVGLTGSACRALMKATKTIPIVMGAAGDVVGSGLVVSLARPGGNVTGLTTMSPEINTKWIELLKEVVPRTKRLTVLLVPGNPAHQTIWREIQRAARAMDVVPRAWYVRGPQEIERAFAGMTPDGTDAFIAPPHLVIGRNMKQIAALAAKRRLPVISIFPHHAKMGALMTYGPNIASMYRRAADYVDKILKGAKPGDLPVERPNKFDLVINLKTAKKLGIAIPPELLFRATEVIR